MQEIAPGEPLQLDVEGAGPKVVDFGVAKLTIPGGTDSGTSSIAGTIVGTPADMAAGAVTWRTGGCEG